MKNKLLLLAAALTAILFYQNCSEDFDPAAYSDNSDSSSLSAPQITTAPQNATINVGQSVTFSVAADGSDLTYQWFKGGPIAGATSPDYTITNATAEQAGSYTVLVSNAGGSDEAAAILTVQPMGTTPLPPPPPPMLASVTVEAEGTCNNGNVVGVGATYANVNLSTGGTVQDGYACTYNFMNAGGGTVDGCRVVISIAGTSYTGPLNATSINAAGYIFTIQYSPGGSSGIIGSTCTVRLVR